MERYRRRLALGAALMAIGFGTVVLILSGLLTDLHAPAWTWALFLLVGIGAGVVVSAFLAAARDRRRATEQHTGPVSPR